jgi:hypothetical protein
LIEIAVSAEREQKLGTGPPEEAGAAGSSQAAGATRDIPEHAAGTSGAPAEREPLQVRARRAGERAIFRLFATMGIVAVGVVIAAIMTSSKSEGWLIGLVVSVVTVVLSAILWSSRRFSGVAP